MGLSLQARLYRSRTAPSATRWANVSISSSMIHPRARFNLRAVPVTGGYVLVVETYPSSGVDLHMVTGYGVIGTIGEGRRASS